MGKRLTQKDRERAFQVQMYALAEERRIGGLSAEEYCRRGAEAWKHCFGTKKPKGD